jgi:hypothetical protein
MGPDKAKRAMNHLVSDEVEREFVSRDIGAVKQMGDATWKFVLLRIRIKPLDGQDDSEGNFFMLRSLSNAT